MSLFVHNLAPVNGIATPLDQPQVGDHYWFIVVDPIVHDPAHSHWLKMANWTDRYPLVRQDFASLNLPANSFVFVVFDGSSFQVQGTLPADLSSVTGILERPPGRACSCSRAWARTSRSSTPPARSS